MKYRVLYIFLPIVFYSCSREFSVKDDLLKTYNRKDSSIVKMNEITPFEWDTLYIFDDRATEYLINNKLQIPLNNFHEFSHKMIFMKDGKIVHFEEEDYYPSERPSNTLYFDLYDYKTKYMKFTPESAVFKFYLTRVDEGTFYDLEPVL